MTSDPDKAFVWVWLPDAIEPVVAGRLDKAGVLVVFTYGQSYLRRKDAIALYLPELPLRRGPISPEVGEVAGCIADAAPDSWGQRVIENRLVGRQAAGAGDLGLLTYLLESGSDRIGALDFQTSAIDYVPRLRGNATLEELVQSAARVEQGIPLTPALDEALFHGSSVGGARPKSLLDDGDRKLIAKFSSTSDTFPWVKAEFVAMELARRAGINVAPVKLTRVLGKDVLLIERFDRPQCAGRRLMVSALTMLGLEEMTARYASYADLSLLIRSRFSEPVATLYELFSRITFNILVGNNDDHPRNHAAFWNGETLSLTPAYDVSPQPRSGGETAQLMAIGNDGYRMSQVTGCIERASIYQLIESEAREIVDHQIEVIRAEWTEVCDEAALSEVERSSLWQRQFLNPYALERYDEK
jgi:serine/threonine-protein kinase HipA